MSKRYRVEFNTSISIVVRLDAADEDSAADEAWNAAEGYLMTLGIQTGDHRICYVDASLDGIGADSVEEARP